MIFKRMGHLWSSLGIAFLYVISEIRLFWHGDGISLDNGFVQGELYTYTILLLIGTVACFVQSIRKEDARLRKIALAIAALTAAKVFFWDMSELSGLGRATAFVALGFVFVGVAWLNKRFPAGEKEKDL